MKKVEFIIIGAMKCGTSALAKKLNEHPMLELSMLKETNFFLKDNISANDYKTLHNQFSSKNKIWFEASPGYTASFLNKSREFKVACEMKTYNPNLKIIYIVRNPIERIVSHYKHFYERGYTDTNIELSIEKDNDYIETSSYFKQISPYLKFFKANQILILFYNDLKRKPEKVINEITNFLEIDEFKKTSIAKANVSSTGSLKFHKKYDFLFKIIHNKYFIEYKKYFPKKIRADIWASIIKLINKRRTDVKPELSENLKIQLLNTVEEDIMEFENLTGRDLSSWRV